MKKIVGIIAALALASAVFADPDVTPTVSSFKGDASLEWIADLDAEKTGMKNSESGEFKIVFVPETTKATEGTDLWGELEIKVAKVEVTGTGAGPALDLTDPADPKFSSGAIFIVPGVSVEKAKIHFSDDDFYARLNIKAPGLSLGGGKIVLATRSDIGTADNPSTSVTLNGAQGFTFEFGLKDLVDFNLQFADNGLQKADDKKFAFVFDATLNGKGFDVEGLEINAGVGYSTEEEKAAFGAKATYKLALDDKYYLRPSVGFTFKDKAKALTAAVLFGWGGENAEPGFKKFNKDTAPANIPNKCTDGVSFALTSNLESKDEGGTMKFIFGVYDSTFVPGLKVGADFQGDFNTIGDAWEMNAAAKYSNTFDIWTIDANFGLKVKKGAETNTGFLYGFGVSTDNSLIQNTKLYINYAGEKAADVGGVDNKGKVTVGTQIHF